MATAKYDELITNCSTSTLDGYMIHAFAGGSPGGYVLQPTNPLPATQSIQAAPGTTLGWTLQERLGGSLQLEHAGVRLAANGQGEPVLDAEHAGSHVCPEPDPSGQFVRLAVDVGGTKMWLAVGSSPPPPAPASLVLTANPTSPHADFAFDERGLALQNSARWLRTWSPSEKLSPMAFLEHARDICTHFDLQHAGPDYWAGLEATPPEGGETYKQRILHKIGVWTGPPWASPTPEQTAGAAAAIFRAAGHFYNHPTSAFNDLDPRKPPEWSEVDDELGSGPYPG